MNITKEKNETKKSGWKRTFIEWGVIFGIGATLYTTGLHTEVIGTLQRAMLWTGFFDADTSNIATTKGPMLSDADYRFSMQTADGEMISLSNFRGDVIFLNVWASWCPPCVAEMPTIETLYDNVSGQDNIHFILLSMDQEEQKATNFMKNKEFPMPYHFPRSRMPNKLQSQYLPTTYVISKDGQIVYKKEGIADYSSLNFAQWMRELAEK